MPHLRSIPGKLGFVCLSILIMFLLLEGALQLRARFDTPSLVPPGPQFVPDERLGFRPNPNFPGHDSRGWTNASPLERADIVVIGDSLVYFAAWPQQVGLCLHRTVYQMGVGGYGPAQYALLLVEALALKPKVIISLFDDADDIYESYKFVYRIGDFKRSTLDPVLDSWVTLTDVNAQEALTRAEAIDPELVRQKYLDCRKPVEVPDPRLQVVHDVLALPPLSPLTNEGMWQRTLAFLIRHSALINVVRKHLVPTASAEDVWSKLCHGYRDQKLTTLFNPGYRILVLDDTDPRIVEGERIALLAFQYIAQRCKLPQCAFYVMMIPTKETAFRSRVESSLRHQPYLVDLSNAEGRLRANAHVFFAREHIATIDTLPLLEALIASDSNPYRKDADGHPSQAGYDAIARAVVERFERDGVGDKRKSS